jgi:cobaltochelatase CobS
MVDDRPKKRRITMGKWNVYKLTKDFNTFKVGDRVKVDTSEGELSKFIQTVKDKKSILIPRSCVSIEKEGTTHSDAERLMKELGIEGEDLTTMEGEVKVSPKKKKKKVAPKKKKKLPAGQVYLSDYTGGRLPTSGIDHIITQIPAKTYTKDQQLDIPEVDPLFVWNPDLLESMWVSWLLGKKMLLSGFPGCGKTTAVRQFAAIIRQPTMRFNGKDGIEASSFLGYPWATKGGMEWKDGLVTQGVQQGYMVTIDEVFKIPAGINMSLQGLWEDGGYLMLDDKPGTAEDKMVKPHEMFRMFLTDNVKGTGDSFDKFSATQVQDTSSLDRFGVTAHVDYMDRKDEVAMLQKKYPKVEESVLNSLVKFAGLVRNGYAKSELSVTLSPRGLQTICEVLELVPDINRAIQMVYTDKLGEHDEQDAVAEMIRTVWG